MPDNDGHGHIVDVSILNRARTKVLRVMVRESVWLFAVTAGFHVAVGVNNSLASSPQAHGYSFVTAASVQLCGWLGTAVYFWVSGTRKQPVTRQQWRFIVILSVLSSLVLVIIQSGFFFLADGGFHEVLLSLVPVIVMAIVSKFLGKTWSTPRKMSPVQLVSRTAPLALAQTIFLAFAFGEVTKLIQEESGLLGSIVYAAAVRGPPIATLLLCRLQANKVTSPLAMSIALGVHRVIYSRHLRAVCGHSSLVDQELIFFIIMANLLYTTVNYVERTLALAQQLSQAPDPSAPRRGQPGQWSLEEGTAAEEEEGDIMLRPLLGAEAQSAADPKSRSLNLV